MLRSFRFLLAAFALAAPLALAGLSGTAEAATPQHRSARSAQHAAAHTSHHRRHAAVKHKTPSRHAARARRTHRPVG
ncbi:hypothetical protein E0493_18860 [Roseomonas sp. M0104]|uniref:Uncharacterized protein n=1 Tax=Teichococcus coralli TaxID=2545983 RepID=A0A845BCU1_9PROT|nr:hypothetical protein [Pseudoroseomonas coralli]MXP65413.1 hypothetical protein [Pseudoroseomonas coralli]